MDQETSPPEIPDPSADEPRLGSEGLAGEGSEDIYMDGDNG